MSFVKLSTMVKQIRSRCFGFEGHEFESSHHRLIPGSGSALLVATPLPGSNVFCYFVIKGSKRQNDQIEPVHCRSSIYRTLTPSRRAHQTRCIFVPLRSTCSDNTIVVLFRLLCFTAQRITRLHIEY